MACSSVWHFCFDFQCLAQWLYDWQTMIAGGFALFGAYMAVRVASRQLKAAESQIDAMREQLDAQRAQLPAMRDQIDVQRAQLDEQRIQAADALARRLRAARASLPATLSAVCEHAERVGVALRDAWPAAARRYGKAGQIDDLEQYTVHADVPAFPPELISALERVVEVTSDEAVAERIESILREAQVLDARARDLRGGGDFAISSLAVFILQAASLYARAESLLGYARREIESVDPEPLWNRAAAALSLFRITQPAVMEMATRAKARGMEPGEANTRRA